MDAEPHLASGGLLRQLSGRRAGGPSFCRSLSFNPRRSIARFSFGRQSSLDPERRSRSPGREDLALPASLDSTIQLLYLACQGDAGGVEMFLRNGVDVNSIDFDGRTALHIAACAGHADVVKLILSWKANIDARDRWGSTAAADAKFYGNIEVYNILRARGARTPRTKKTPMIVSDPEEIPDYELNSGQIQIRRGEIQKGAYQVGKWNDLKVSVKILNSEAYTDTDSVAAFNYELNLLQKCRHPNLIQFVGAVTQKAPMMIVLEYHPKGDLGSYLQKKGRLRTHKAFRYGIEIARGMNYLHHCKPDPIIHCDLKPKNIFLAYGGQLRVAGFGIVQLTHISSKKAKLKYPKSQIDSRNLYMAPEIYRDGILDASADIFSFGLILYEMIEGSPAFHTKCPEEASRLLCLEGLRPPLRNKSKSYFSEFKRLIEECWDPRPEVRPSFSEIIVRLDKIAINYAKQKKGGWKGTFKLPWKI